jgi:hypothetical protein
MPLQLIGIQIEQLMNALFEAFPSEAALAIMVRTKLDKELDELVKMNESRQHQCFRLVIWANSQGKVEDLIRAAHDANPGSPKLKECMAWLTPAASSVLSELLSPQPPALNLPIPEVWKFDLKMVDECVNYIVPRRDLGMQRLFGFVVPEAARPAPFHRNFCEKLKQRVGSEKMVIGKPFAYSRNENGDIVHRHIQQITTYAKPNLENGDVVCSIAVEPQRKKASNYAQQLWTALQARFSYLSEHCLIVILFTTTSFGAPTGMKPLSPPHFEISDVWNWTDDVEAVRKWGNDFRDKWRNWLIQDSTLGGDVALDVDRTYDNLSRSLIGLRTHDSPDAFMAELMGS